LNWADFYQPIYELYQTADHPALSPDFCHLEWRSKRWIILADLVSPRGKPVENTCHLTWLGGGGGTLGVRFGLAHFSNGLWFFDDFSKLT
jgi:hypothetical protein